MGLLSYIKGRRRGADAHRLEREAMQDAFLADALDGYDDIAGADVVRRVSLLQQKVARRAARRSRVPLYSAVAALLLLCLTVSVYLFFRYDLPREELAVLDRSMVPEEIPLTDSPNRAAAEDEGLPEAVSPEKELSGSVRRQKRAADVSSPVVESSDRDAEEPAVTANVSDLSDNLERVAVKEMSWAAAPPEMDATAVTDSAGTDSRRAVVHSQRKLSAAAGAAALPNAVLPTPAGGYDACYDYIRRNTAAVSDTAGRDTTRTVILRFVVDRKGRPGDFTVVKSFSPEAAQEVIRLLQSGPDWSPSGPVPAFTVVF